MMHLFTRKEWHARAPRPMTSGNHPTEAFVHYTENNDAVRVDSLAEQVKAVRGIQDFHMDGRGWSDIAYHFVVFQPEGRLDHAHVFSGRAIGNVPAAQLNHNTNTLAISVYAGPHDDVHRNTRFAIESIIRMYPTVNVVGGHRDVVATQCPGDKLYASIPRIAQACDIATYKKGK